MDTSTRDKALKLLNLALYDLRDSVEAGTEHDTVGFTANCFFAARIGVISEEECGSFVRAMNSILNGECPKVYNQQHGLLCVSDIPERGSIPSLNTVERIGFVERYI